MAGRAVANTGETTAYRKNIAGVIPGCFSVFWGVKRT
jgi:hypothetical protein